MIRKDSEFNENKVKTIDDGKVINMRLSADGIMFKYLTTDMYQNPIGSIVREVTSNCFDSHIEAKNESPDNPVIVKHTYDKISKRHYISFFDKGVGMSPKRVEEVYSVYGESTKNETNDEIGGFGVGGKSPMAYTESFFVITRFNGIEYHYEMFRGKQGPAIKLINSVSTKEVNGTEVRVPIKEGDLNQFNREVTRQLFYFENIVFQGFDNDAVLNDYKIYKGEHFIYRGDTYDNHVHICLGKVAYPINWSDLGLSSYENNVEIALKFNIGDIEVTPNRENIKYTQETKQMIIDKLDLVKKEIGVLMGKQYSNVVTLADYYEVKNNFGNLNFDGTGLEPLHVGDWIKRKDVKFENFELGDLPVIPKQYEVVNPFYNVHRYGNKGYSDSFSFGIGHVDATYQCAGEFKRKIIKQAYLNHLHDKVFTILKPYNDEQLYTSDSTRLRKLRIKFGMIEPQGFGNPDKEIVNEKDSIKMLKRVQKEIVSWVLSTFESYDTLDVPEDFIEARKEARLSEEIMNKTISLRDCNYYHQRSSLKIRNIANFKGRIFYGVGDDSVHIVKQGATMYKGLFGDDHMDRLYNYGKGFAKGKGIMFITVAKTNAKYIEMCPNCYPIDQLYPRMLRRKMINPANIKIAIDYMNKAEQIDDMYRNPTMDVISKEIPDAYAKVKAEVDSLQIYRQYQNVSFDSSLVSKYHKVDNVTPDLKIENEKDLDFLLMVQEVNKDALQWVDLSRMWHIESQDFKAEKYIGLVDVLKKVMTI